MKKRIGTIAAILVLAVGIIALYWYIDRADREEREPAGTVAEQVLARDLEKNYPPTPYAVAELYCDIVKGIYDKDTTEKQIETLVQMQLQLFDKEFTELNPYETLLEATKTELSEAAEKKIVFAGYVVDRASNVEKWKYETIEYASIQLQFTTTGGSGRSTASRTLVMRRDEDKRYKILGWRMAEDGGGDSENLSN